MLVYRVTRRKYADLFGVGGTLKAGRWHKQGHRVIYTSSSIALAAIEYAVNSSQRPVDSVLMEIDIPGDSIDMIEDRIGGPLPGNWPFVEDQTRELGSRWLASGTAIGLSVPSIVIPLERNFILNPNHAEFSRVEQRRIVPFFFDPRLFGSSPL